MAYEPQALEYTRNFNAHSSKRNKDIYQVMNKDIKYFSEEVLMI